MRTVERLRRLRFVVETAYEARLSAAKDEEVLLVAANRGALLLTHDEHDYKLLFRAWHRWCNSWGVGQEHAGIVIYPQTWSPEVAVSSLINLFGEIGSFRNCLVHIRSQQSRTISHAADPATWPK
jgi:hypothetical protein